MILTLNSSDDDVARRAGGKGKNLVALAKRGLSVPPFFVIGVDAFDEALKNARVNLEQDAATLADAVRSLAVPSDVDAAVRKALASLTLPVAVRSSALAEDSRLHSFAGQLQTFLYVESADAVIDAVRKCWASAFSAHALAYMKQHGIPISAARVGVVVQSMVDADVAGVAFTADPTSGDADTMVISSVLGLGEGLVSGLLDSDDVRVDKRTRAIRDQKVTRKEKRLVRAPGGGVREELVPKEQQEVASLDGTLLRELVDAALAIEEHYGAPQDIEWAISKGKLYLLQARPVTTPLAGQKPVQIWDNSNIIESYFGVTSPLTFTFAKNAYHSVYVQFCQVMRVPQSVITKSDDVFKNMLGYVDGRIYYNLLHWYHLIGLFPGFKHNKSFMEGMMGVRESLPADAQALLQLPAPATIGERVSQALLGVSMARRFFALDSIVTAYRAHFDENYERYRRVRFEGKSFEELMRMQSELEGVFLANWKAPIINDFFAMMAFGLLRKLVGDWGLDSAGTLQNDLLCGEGGVESAVPTELLIELALFIKANAELARAFQTESVTTLQSLVADDSRFVEVKARIADYVERYGFRCMNELKLEEPDLHTDPSFIYQALQNYVQHPPRTVKELREREQEIRTSAEGKVAWKLTGLRARIFAFVLKHARKTVKNRENLRLCRTKVFGIARRIYDAIGTNLHARGMLASPRDIYFLRREELFSLLDASSTTRDWKGVVALRQADRAAYLASEGPDDRFVTRGGVYLGSALKRAAVVATNDGTIKGTGCCPGTVRAPAKVIRDPRGDLSMNGNILVAERTDPGWTPLFPSASGVLVERGSLLSHSAIVARELGIPCVVGIAGLLATVHTGDDVEMDGGAGTIRLHSSAASVAKAAE